MNRLNLVLSKLAFTALLLLVCSSAVYAQTVTYTLSGTLSLSSGSDPLMLSGTDVVASATIDQTLTPTSSATTATSSSNTYSGVTVGLQIMKLGPAVFACDASVSVTLTDNVGGPDTIAINSCTIDLFGS